MAAAIAGLAFLIGGLWLVALGGSIYYLLAGAVLLGSGTLIALGRGTGAKGYALFLTVTISWAVAESGFAPWPLTARLLAPALLGLLFVIPGARASLGRGASLAAGVGALALLLVVGAHFGRDSHDIRAAEAIAASAPIPADAAGDEWTSWGGDKGGSRFSRLAQITPANVGKLEAAWTFHTRIPSDPPPATSPQHR
ncbi:hypothetical protein ACFSLT_19620 [Novosphingobium resinovorum]